MEWLCLSEVGVKITFYHYMIEWLTSAYRHNLLEDAVINRSGFMFIASVHKHAYVECIPQSVLKAGTVHMCLFWHGIGDTAILREDFYIMAHPPCPRLAIMWLSSIAETACAHSFWKIYSRSSCHCSLDQYKIFASSEVTYIFHSAQAKTFNWHQSVDEWASPSPANQNLPLRSG